MNAGCPASSDEAKDIATFFQAFGYVAACRDILKLIEEGVLDIGPMATAMIAKKLVPAHERASELGEKVSGFISYWEAKGEASRETLHTLEDILGDIP